MARMKCADVFVVIIFTLIASAQSANILFALSMSSMSHKNFMDPIMSALVKKGHNVTIVSPFAAHFNPPGVTTVQLKSVTINAVTNEETNLFTMSTKKVVFLTERQVADMIYDIAEATLSDPAFKNFMHSGTKFDLIAFDATLNDHLLVLPHHFKAPVVLMFPAELQAVTYWNLNIPYPPSVHPILTNPFPTPMSFWHRLVNTASVALSVFYRQHVMQPVFQDLVEKYFPGTPSLMELEKNASLVMVNTFPSLTEPKPLLPFVVELGGIHCRPAKKLNKDLETVIENSGEHGFILASFGSVANGSFIPEEFLKKLMKVFSTLNQTIIFKFEGEMTNVPKNVKLQKWVPQQDVLGHEKCRLFITHGGLFSTLETVYHAVPVIVFPLIFDQPNNALLSSKHGYGIVHDWQQVTPQDLSSSIKQILYNPTFKMNAVKMSALFKDRPIDPVDSSVYWMEYVIRTGGAHHLKTNAGHLSFFQYFMLDVIVFVAVVLTSVLLIVSLTLRTIFRFLRNKLRRSETAAKGKSARRKKVN